MTRIIATSDFHGKPPNIPPCDLLILGGDLCQDGPVEEQRKWLDTHFRKWLEKAPAREIVAIAGNHDVIFEKAPHLIPEKLRMHYLQDSSVTLFGLKIYGMPWQLPFYGAFNLPEKRLEEVYEKIPVDIDILVSHGPPFGILDQMILPSTNPDDEVDRVVYTGSISLRKKVFTLKPKLVIFGHIHEQAGQKSEEGICFANVSHLNDSLEPTYPPQSFIL